MAINNSEKLRDSVVHELRGFDTQLKKLDMTEQSKRLEKKMDEYGQGIFHTLFTGQFSAGKSTTLNAILHQKLLSVSINPETPVITRIVNGQDNLHVVISHRDGSPETTMTLKQFQDEFHLDSADPKKFENIRFVTVERKLPLDTVVFVDSPGLGNTDLDDYIANDFSKNADAVVFMVHANEPLNKNDREYIQRNYEKRHFKNLFFVVNWYNVVAKEEQPKLRARIRELLKPVFEDEHGKFDEALYEQRVFFVNSYIAECFRTGSPYTVLVGNREIPIDVTEEDVNGGGLPEFEGALMDFLNSSDKDRDGYIGFLPRLAGMYKESKESVEARKRDALASVDELKSREETMEANIQKLEETLNGIQKVFDDTLDNILLNAGAAYDDFVRSVENNWDDYFNSIQVPFGMTQGAQILLTKVKGLFGGLFGGGNSESDKLARDAEFQRIVQPIADAIEEYLKQQSEQLGANITARSETALKKMESSLKVYAEDLEQLQKNGLDLREIINSLTGSNRVNVDEISKGGNLAQVLIALLLFGNVDDAIDNMLGGGIKWGEFIKKTLVTQLTEFVIAMIVGLFTGTYLIYIIGRVIFGLFRLNQNVSNLGKRILVDPDHKTRNEVVQALRDQRDASLSKMEIQFSGQFSRNSSMLTQGTVENIKQQKAQLEKMIEMRQQSGFDAEAQAKEMDTALGEMLKIFKELSLILQNKAITEQEILDKAVSTVVEAVH